jgi:hypothetical protein
MNTRRWRDCRPRMFQPRVVKYLWMFKRRQRPLGPSLISFNGVLLQLVPEIHLNQRYVNLFHSFLQRHFLGILAILCEILRLALKVWCWTLNAIFNLMMMIFTHVLYYTVTQIYRVQIKSFNEA